MCRIFCVCAWWNCDRNSVPVWQFTVIFYFYKLFSAIFWRLLLFVIIFFYQHLTCVWTQTSMENSLWMIDKYTSNFLCKYIYIYLKKKSLFRKQKKFYEDALCPYFAFKIILTKKISCQELRLWNEIFTKPHFLYIFV